MVVGCQKCNQKLCRAILSVDEEFHLKTTALAQMETVSFCAGVRRKKFSVQLETAPKNTSKYKSIFLE